MLSRYLSSAAAAALCLAAHAALAQTDPSLPAATPSGEAIVVTATRSGDAVPRAEVAGSVTLLDPALLAFRQTRNVSDILRDVPGVAVSRSGAPGGFTQIRLRGSEANHVLVLIDGIEASDPFPGEFDFAGLLADEGTRVEVLRGQQSSLYGSAAIGGVVQVLTATGHDIPGISARVEGGSHGTADGAVRAGGVAGALDYAVTGTFTRSDGYPVAVNGVRDVGERGGAGSAKLTYALAPNAKLTAVARYTRTDADFDGFDGDTASPTYGRIIDTPGTRSETEAVYGLVRGEVSGLAGRWTNALGIQVADSRRDAFDPTGRTSGDTGVRVKGSADTSLRFGAQVRHRVTLAVDAERESFRNRDPSGFAFNGWHHLTNIGLVAAYDVVAGGATLGASLRRDLNSQFADATTYRVTASYAAVGGTRVHAAAGSGIKDPGEIDLYAYSSGRYIGNPNLTPERSDGYEVGVSQTLFGGAATADVTWFDNRLHDQIYVTYLPPTFEGIPRNRTTLSTQQGVEASIGSRIGDAWRVDLAYTHLRARADGAEEVRRAPDIASANVTWSAPRGLASATATVRYNGPQTDVTFTDPTGATAPIVRLHSFTLVQLAAQAKLTPRLDAFGRIENLLGQAYQEVFSYRGAPRTVLAGLRANL